LTIREKGGGNQSVYRRAGSNKKCAQILEIYFNHNYVQMLVGNDYSLIVLTFEPSSTVLFVCGLYLMCCNQ